MHSTTSKTTTSWLPKMNILVPGEPRAPALRHWSYCENFTVPSVATVSVLGVTDLAADGAPYRNSYHQEYISPCGVGIRWISQAATRIRKSIDNMDEEYIRRVVGAKRERAWKKTRQRMNDTWTGAELRRHLKTGPTFIGADARLRAFPLLIGVSSYEFCRARTTWRKARLIYYRTSKRRKLHIARRGG